MDLGSGILLVESTCACALASTTWTAGRRYVREPIGILGYVRSWMPLRQTKLHRLDALHDLVAAGMLLFGGRVVV